MLLPPRIDCRTPGVLVLPTSIPWAVKTGITQHPGMAGRPCWQWEGTEQKGPVAGAGAKSGGTGEDDKPGGIGTG